MKAGPRRGNDPGGPEALLVRAPNDTVPGADVELPALDPEEVSPTVGPTGRGGKKGFGQVFAAVEVPLAFASFRATCFADPFWTGLPKRSSRFLFFSSSTSRSSGGRPPVWCELFVSGGNPGLLGVSVAAVFATVETFCARADVPGIAAVVVSPLWESWYVVGVGILAATRCSASTRRISASSASLSWSFRFNTAASASRSACCFSSRF
ncbi:hypothetical protein BU23DRAFT_242049 [Bimuria novae-zelandiae CBS 107.79]|uniref:Uncharacterized protein n=1 Tax=Bimuria novae-zelandiae CBS 107.79 TaxID=1447943 RepID=A0A6A5UX43_9PLEO|nr:hypothetical protein BU23DRAFT_242049 [Bimuria novae-zelandiae CBS 107.79]